MSATRSYVVEENGERFIPATQRADGTWRKARRVKEGYTPQDEVPLYQSKGKQWATAGRSHGFPVGTDPALIREHEMKEAEKLKKQKQAAKKASNPNYISHSVLKPMTMPPPVKETTKPAPKQSDKAEKKPKPAKTEAKKPAPVEVEVAPDPVKRLRNLRKKLKEIEALEQKINSKQLPNPDKDQLEKVKKKDLLEDEILELERLSLNS